MSREALNRKFTVSDTKDFIWATDQDKMFSHGVSAEIWVRGCRHHKPSESILGPKLAFNAPVLDKILRKK